MDDAWARDPSDARKRPVAMMKQGIDQSAVEVARGGVNHQARRFVDHQQVLVLEYDLERDVLRLVMGRRWLGHGKAECLFAPHLDRGITKRLASGLHGTAAD